MTKLTYWLTVMAALFGVMHFCSALLMGQSALANRATLALLKDKSSLGFAVDRTGAWSWSFPQEDPAAQTARLQGPAVAASAILGMPFVRLRCALPPELFEGDMALALGSRQGLGALAKTAAPVRQASFFSRASIFGGGAALRSSTLTRGVDMQASAAHLRLRNSQRQLSLVDSHLRAGSAALPSGRLQAALAAGGSGGESPSRTPSVTSQGSRPKGRKSLSAALTEALASVSGHQRSRYGKARGVAVDGGGLYSRRTAVGPPTASAAQLARTSVENMEAPSAELSGVERLPGAGRISSAEEAAAELLATQAVVLAARQAARRAAAEQATSADAIEYAPAVSVKSEIPASASPTHAQLIPAAVPAAARACAGRTPACCASHACVVFARGILRRNPEAGT